MTDFSRMPIALRAQLQKVRRRRLKEKQTFFALLGNGSGAVAVTNTKGKVWVRFQSSADSDGNVTYTPPKDINAGTNNYFEYDGSPVRVGFDDYGELEVKRSDSKKARDAGLDTRILNTGNPARKWLYLRNFANFKSLAPGASTVVSVRSLLYDDNYGNLNLFAGTRRLEDKIDLASFIPSAGNHRVVCLFLRTTDNTIQPYGSTIQGIATPIVLEDYQECYAQRDAESIPIQAYILQNNQTVISMLDSAEDLRQIFNMPQVLGIPDPVDKNAIIREGRSVHYTSGVEVLAGVEYLGAVEFCGETVQNQPKGHAYQDDTGTVVTIDEKDVDVVVDGWTLHNSRGISFQNGQEFLIATAGEYDLEYQVSMAMAGGANQELEFCIAITSTREVSTTTHRRVTTNTDTGSASGLGELILHKGDLVQLAVRNESSTNNVIIEHGQLRLRKTNIKVG